MDIHDRPAKLVGTVIDAATRRPVPQVKVAINRQGFAVDTDRNGCFLFDKLERGKTIVISCTKKGYRQASTTYKANMDQDQSISIKMGPLGSFAK
ncbi:MAG: carboxypeptidase-like regulatory domain-containing protein [Candidatus Wallbacteria bacterium]|nr:carboxypeptidase-like regulatory domain-containing protein [Candidatus Wallbacteria bacterium]